MRVLYVPFESAEQLEHFVWNTVHKQFYNRKHEWFSVMEAHHLGLDRRRCSDCPALRVDDRQMAQALLNVLKNAIEASPDNGLIQCLLAHEPPVLSLTVTNNGPQIPPDTFEQIFEPFFTTKPTGSGLGLPLVKRVESGGRC